MSSYISTLLWGTSQLDDAVDKATSELLPSGSEDIALNLEISDQIRSKSVAPKDAMRAMKRRLNHKNPNVQLLALGLTDTCIKNGGDPFLVEVASREFMDNLVSILKQPVLNHDVKTKILRLVQNWAIAFEGRSHLNYVGEVYRTLQREGFNFPPRDLAATSSAMVDTQTAPEWIDSDVCLRCRDAFTFTNRKHHCRNCGQVFDQKCSSKSMALPHFGIAQEVRVCDNCYPKLIKKNKGHRQTQSVSTSRHRSARDFADAELQRAIQLSLEEVGAAGSKRPGYVPSASSWQSSEPPLVDRTSYPGKSEPQAIEEDDPDLRAAIEASLREANAPQPSAPLGMETPRVEQTEFVYTNGPGYAQSYPPTSTTPKPTIPALPKYDLEPLEEDAILTFGQTVEQLQQQGGRDLTRYPAVTELYDKANSLRPKLAMSLSDAGRKEQLLTEMHEKLSEAVKLYDRLLTAQVSHHPWRPSVAAQPSTAAYTPPQQAPASYGQWSIPGQVAPTSPQAQSTQPAYFTGATQQNGVQSSPPEHYAQSVAHVAQYSQPSQPYGVASPPVSIPSYRGHPTGSIEGPSATPAPVSVQSPPPVAQQAAYAPPPSTFSPTQAPLPPQASLARHSSDAAYPPQQPNTQPAHISRAKTMSHAPQQLQQLQQAAVPQLPLPNFPVAPTAAPQPYQTYTSPPPVEEREALLIDL